jgi:hypothetical protein
MNEKEEAEIMMISKQCEKMQKPCKQEAECRGEEEKTEINEKLNRKNW